jgi:hypothetical protein
MLLLSLFSVTAATLATLADASATATYDPIEMLCLVNQQRVQNGARPLGLNSDLTNAAIYHSQDQANMHTMTHSDSQGRTLGERITASGYTQWLSVGENVAYGYPSETTCMTAWMNSPGHRANILNPQFTHFGSAVRSSDGTPYYTQDFGGDGHTYNFPVCPSSSNGGSGADADDSQQFDTSNGEMDDGQVHIASVPSRPQPQQQPQMMMMSSPPPSPSRSFSSSFQPMQIVTYTTTTEESGGSNNNDGFSPNESGGNNDMPLQSGGGRGQLADSQFAPSSSPDEDCSSEDGGNFLG